MASKTVILPAIQRVFLPLRLLSQKNLFGDLPMKLSHPQFAASACLLAMLAAPAGLLAHDSRRPNDPKKTYAVPEPSTLVMTALGMALAMGLVLVGLRRNRPTSAGTPT
jgi:hypothetical protein